MRYTPLSSDFYRKVRTQFMKQMLPRSLAVFNSNDIYPVSADSKLAFAQHRDLFYLSSVDQEESILVLFPDAVETRHREVLFLKETNAHIAVWGRSQTHQRAGKGNDGNWNHLLVARLWKSVFWTGDSMRCILLKHQWALPCCGRNPNPRRPLYWMGKEKIPCSRHGQKQPHFTAVTFGKRPSKKLRKSKRHVTSPKKDSERFWTL